MCVTHIFVTYDAPSSSFQHHELKEVHKASKRAKVFETQKVVKRLKAIRHVFGKSHTGASSLTLDIGKKRKMKRLGSSKLS